MGLSKWDINVNLKVYWSTCVPFFLVSTNGLLIAYTVLPTAAMLKRKCPCELLLMTIVWFTYNPEWSLHFWQLIAKLRIYVLTIQM